MADSSADFEWRWTATPEERLLAQSGDEPMALPLPSMAGVETEADWPGFRGPDRNSKIPGVRIETDWSVSPPVELWRRPVGPGWSSFAVRGDVFYTQEQRGADEVVSCYDLTTGDPRWTGPNGGDGYSSPHFLKLGGVPQVLLRPYFSDFVVHEGHALGFDGGILACIDVEDGELALVGDVLLVRNDQEMAAFRLALAE